MLLAVPSPLERRDLRITQLRSGTTHQWLQLWSLLMMVSTAMRKDPTADKNGSNDPIPNLYFSVELKVTKLSGKY